MTRRVTGRHAYMARCSAEQASNSKISVSLWPLVALGLPSRQSRALRIVSRLARPARDVNITKQARRESSTYGNALKFYPVHLQNLATMPTMCSTSVRASVRPCRAVAVRCSSHSGPDSEPVLKQACGVLAVPVFRRLTAQALPPLALRFRSAPRVHLGHLVLCATRMCWLLALAALGYRLLSSARPFAFARKARRFAVSLHRRSRVRGNALDLSIGCMTCVYSVLRHRGHLSCGPKAG